MTIKTFLYECLLGGLGLQGYAYQADVYCVDCAYAIIHALAPKVAGILNGTDDPLFADSETVPQPIFFGEADYAQHCAECGEYLYGPEEDESDE